jgi:heat shock protein HslJ
MSRRPPRPFALLLGSLLVASALGACGEDGPAGPAPDGRPVSLAGTQWRVVSIAGQVPIAGSEPTIAFGADTVKGSGGCNSFGGSYRYDSTGVLAFGDLGMTAMACQERRRNEIETVFLRTLGSANLVSVDTRGLLVLSGPAGQIQLANAAVPNPTD